MARKTFLVYVGLTVASGLSIALPAMAANSFSNSLTGFTGNSSLGGTQTAVGAAGFTFADTRGFTENPPGTFFDPSIQFDANGAHFGDLWGGDGGRNFMRTNDGDYANYDFVAEITVVVPNLDGVQASWLGMGTGDVALFGWPDWSTQFSSVMVVPEANATGTDRFYTTMFTDNDNPIFANNVVPALASGTHRLRLTLDRSAISATATFSIDLNYAGGAFVSDFSAPALDVSGLYGGDGWPFEPSRIFFGGDDGAVIKDFSVNVTGPAVIVGDFDSDGDIDSNDWVIFRTNQEADLSAQTLEAAYFHGDLDKNRTNDHLDFAIFKDLFEATHGAGSFVAMVSSVPEPSSALLILFTGLFARPVRRRVQAASISS